MSKMRSNDLHNFQFQIHGSGCYKVTYHTEKRGDYWVAYINDMGIIDDTRNADWAKVKDIEWLRHLVVTQGTHYSYWGAKIY